MSAGIRVWVYVISWYGHQERATNIAAALDGHADHLAVIYSNPTDAQESGAGEWIQVPNSDFYAEKFAATVAHFDGDVMLHVHADARCDDWPGLVARCREIFALYPHVGIWQPDTSGAALPPAAMELPVRAQRAQPVDAFVREALEADSIVWAITRTVCDRFRGDDLARDHYGWGVTSAAAAIAHARLLDVVLDSAVPVDHTPGSSYNTDAADAAQIAFAHDFLSPVEFRYWQLMMTAVAARVELASAEDTLKAQTHERAHSRYPRRLSALRNFARSTAVRVSSWRSAK